jgi:hypothetical protein
VGTKDHSDAQGIFADNASKGDESLQLIIVSDPEAGAPVYAPDVAKELSENDEFAGVFPVKMRGSNMLYVRCLDQPTYDKFVDSAQVIAKCSALVCSLATYKSHLEPIRSVVSAAGDPSVKWGTTSL